MHNVPESYDPPTLRFAEGVFTSAFTVPVSAETDSFEPVKATIQVFESADRDGDAMRQTTRQIVALISIPGSYVHGVYAVAVMFPDGIWRVITAGCDPTIPDYTDPEL